MSGVCEERHRAAGFRASLDRTEAAAMPADLDAHPVPGNAATHKTRLARGWLVRRPRRHPHLAPTSAGDPEAAILARVAGTHAHPKPSARTETADGTLASGARFRQRTSNPGH